MQIVIQTDQDNDALYIAFGAASLEQGRVTKSVRVNDDVTLDFASDGKLVGLDILNASTVLGSDFGDVRLTSLIGVKEAAELVGVRKPNFLRDFASNPDFPQPVCELASGRFWLRGQVEEYVSRRLAKSSR